MIKRTLITLALGMASSSFAAVAALPSDRQYDSIVTLQTGSSSDDLNAILQALGKSVGLTVVTQDIPAKGVNFDVSGKPFRDVWGLLLQVNDLDYELLPNGMVLVGPTAVVAKVRPPVSSAPVAAATVERRFYTVNGDPTQISTLLTKELPGLIVNIVSAGQGQTGGNKVTPPTLSITGTVQQHGEVKRILAAVDRSPEEITSVSAERHFYTVNGSPEKVAELLNKEVPGLVASVVTKDGDKTIPPTISATGTTKQHEEVKRILAAVDRSPEQVTSAVAERRFYETNGAVEKVAQLLVKELPGLSANIIVVSKKKDDADANGTISVMATSQQHEEVKRILAAVDPTSVKQKQFFEIRSNATDMVKTLTEQIPGLVVEATGKDGQLLAVQGTTRQLEQATALIETSKKVFVQRTFVLKNAEASYVRGVLSQAQEKDSVTISNNVGNSNIDVNAPTAAAPSIITTITPDNVNGSSATSSSLFTPGGGKTSDLNTSNSANTSNSTTKSGEEVKVQIIADERTNTIILRGYQEKVDQLSDLLAVLDKTIVNEVKTSQFFTVQGDADEIVKVLNRQFSELKIEKVGSDGRVLSVMGSPDLIARAGNLVAAMDKAPSASAVRKSYVVNGDPVALVALLKKQFSGVGADAVVGLDGKAVSQVISVTATPEQQDAIGDLLAQVDSPEEAAVWADTQKVFILSHARASDIQKSLEDVQETEVKSLQGSGSNGSNQGSSVTQGNSGLSSSNTDSANSNSASTTQNQKLVVILADDRTNTLVLKGRQNKIDKLAELIPYLDKKPPVVNVQVRIQEVSETAVRSLGLDWTAGVGNFVTKLFGGSLTALFDATQSSVGFNIGASLTASEQQGFSKRVDEANLMIESSNRETDEKTSDGSTIPRLIPKLVSGGKLKINLPGTGGSKAIEQELDYGVIVEIPKVFIDAEGVIHLKLNAKVTNFSNPPTDPTFINATNREAQTTMTLKPGQTVLLGGLLTAQERNSSTGIPFLSSIPIIGNFFKKSETNNEKTQLMLVVTANPVE